MYFVTVQDVLEKYGYNVFCYCTGRAREVWII